MADRVVENGVMQTEERNATAFSSNKSELQAGEKGFTVFLLAVCAYIFYLSVTLWQRKPGIAGPAIIPMLASGFAALLTLFAVVANIWKRTPLSGGDWGAKAKAVIEYIFPLNVAAVLIAIVIYCVLLLYKASFYVITPLFLWGLMTFLARGNYLKNILWTGILMVFLVLVFRMIFNVVLP